MQLKFYGYLALAALFASCGAEQKTNAPLNAKGGSIQYAQRFGIMESGAAKIVYLFGDRHSRDTTARFVISADTNGLREKYKEAFIIKGPCQKIAALSSIYASMFVELGALENMCAVDNMDYICNAAIIQKYNKGELRELAKTPRVDLEQTVTLKPDILVTFGMGEGRKDVDAKLAQTGIPVAISVDHLEETPLARAEWIKFFAAFAGRSAQADSIFSQVEKNYEELKSLAAKAGEKPAVFSEIKYSEFWYMPGGKSYMACLMKDAGANYLWSDNSDFGSLPLSFEQVYARAKDADYWLNLSTLKTKKELLAFESRYAEFKAYKTGNLYNNVKHTNAKGYSNYWETGMIYPDRILSDLILIFHPALKEQVKNELFYYTQLD